MLNLRKFYPAVALFCAAVASFCVGTPGQGQEAVEINPSSPTSIRVLTYNIHHGRGSDEKVDLVRVAEVIKAARPDVVALQEVDDQTQRTGHVDQTAELARLVGMNAEFIHQIDFEGGRYGQAVLSKFPMSAPQLHWLPGNPDRERRMAGAVTIDLGARSILFVTTHLHHANETFRELQAQELNLLFAPEDACERIVILAGDLNATPESGSLRILSQRWRSATADNSDILTFPATNANRQLDYILFRPEQKLQLVSADVIAESMASDHRPVVVELLFKD